MLYEKIKLNLRGKTSYPYRQPSPSTLSSCVRLIWYKVHRPEVVASNEPELELLFGDGHAGEEQMIRIITEIGGYQVTHRQARVIAYIGKHRSSGMIDGVANGNQISPPGFVFDTKRMSPFIWQEFKRNGVASVPHYQDQLTPYMLGTKESLGFTSDKAILFAQNRENADIFDDLVHLDQERVDRLEHVLDLREEALQEAKPPLRPYSRDSWECKTCPAKDFCWLMSGKNTLTLQELQVSDREQALTSAIDYAALQSDKRNADSKLNELRSWFDSLLEKYECKDVVIETGEGLIVRPNIRVGEHRDFDELKMSYDHPEIYQEYISTKPTTQLRFEIRFKGKLISQ